MHKQRGIPLPVLSPPRCCVGEGEFGIVHKAVWFGTIVAVKILKETSAVALGDFRTELNVLQKVHHPHTVGDSASCAPLLM